MLITEENAKEHMERALWQFIETAAAFPTISPDERIWGHVFAYYPLKGWVLPVAAVNDLQAKSINETIAKAKRAHMTDIEIRKDGKDMRYEADWVKHMRPMIGSPEFLESIA